MVIHEYNIYATSAKGQCGCEGHYSSSTPQVLNRYLHRWVEEASRKVTLTKKTKKNLKIVKQNEIRSIWLKKLTGSFGESLVSALVFDVGSFFEDKSNGPLNKTNEKRVFLSIVTSYSHKTIQLLKSFFSFLHFNKYLLFVYSFVLKRTSILFHLIFRQDSNNNHSSETSSERGGSPQGFQVPGRSEGRRTSPEQRYDHK